MDVLNRRMFNRNARNRLSNMGGLPSVKKFRVGGDVGMEDLKYIRDLISSGNVQGLQSLQPKKLPPFKDMRMYDSTLARTGLQGLNNSTNQSTAIPDFFKNLKSLGFGKRILDSANAETEDANVPETVSENLLKDATDAPKYESFVAEGKEFTDPPNYEYKGFKDTEATQGGVRETQEEPPLQKPEELADNVRLETKIETVKNNAQNIVNELNSGDPTTIEVDKVSENNTAKGQEITKEIENISKADDKAMFEDIDLNKKLLEAVGAKSEKEDLTLEEHYKKMQDVSKLLDLKVDPEEENKMRGFNLAMFGFAMAAGQSPNALQNIGNAGKEFVKLERADAKEKKAKKQKLDQFNLTNALLNDRAETQFFQELEKMEKSQVYDAIKTTKLSEDKKEIAYAQISAQKANLQEQLKSKEAMFDIGNDLNIQLAKLSSDDKKNIAKINANIQLAGLDAKLFTFKEGQDFDRWKVNTSTELTKQMKNLEIEAALERVVVGNYDSSIQATISMRQGLGLDDENIFGDRQLEDGSTRTFMEDALEFAKVSKSTKSGPQPYPEERDYQDTRRLLMNNEDTVEDILNIVQDKFPGKNITRASPEFSIELDKVVKNIINPGGVPQKVDLTTN
tara:strand:- start:373 stop:2241 length:1869 start_codon:yes stop_codon:yes gene_type:complete